MPVYLLSGTDGSGKTYGAVVEFLLPHVKRWREVDPTKIGRIVYNIDGIEGNEVIWSIMSGVSESVIHDNFVPYNNREIDIWDYDLSYDLKGNEVFKFKYLQDNDWVVMDECQDKFPAHGKEFDSKSERYNHFMKYYTHHRKFGHKWLIITQDPNNISSLIKGLCKTTYEYNKATLKGKKDAFVKRIYRGGHALQSTLAMKEEGKFKPDFFRLFSSYKSDNANEEVRTHNVFFTPLLKKLYVLLGLCVLGSIVSFYVFSKSGTAKAISTKGKSNLSGSTFASSNLASLNVSQIVYVRSFSIIENLCQVVTDEGVLVVPSTVCNHMPYSYNGRVYQFEAKKSDAGRGGGLF